MVSLPFGLSVHHFISSIGADAGFASLIGLALLVLLYFAHARETATLRARADEAGLRVQELEAQVANLAEQFAALPAEISVRAVGPRIASHGGVQEHDAAPMRATVLPPAAPAGVAAPALAAATRLIPLPEAPPVEYEPASAAGGANGSGHPATVAAAATAGRPVAAAAGVVSRPAAAPPRTGGPPPRAGGPPRPGVGPSRPTGASRPAVPLRPVRRRSPTGRAIAAVVVVLIAVAAIVAGVIALTGHGRAKSANKPSVSSALASRRTSAATVRPSTVTVTVLNGTDMQGLAGRVLARLVGDGYRKGTATNAADQTHTSSVVTYMAPSERRDALAVAAALKLTPASVQPIDAATKAIACPPAQACTTSVVVTVGRDLAATQ